MMVKILIKTESIKEGHLHRQSKPQPQMVHLRWILVVGLQLLARHHLSHNSKVESGSQELLKVLMTKKWRRRRRERSLSASQEWQWLSPESSMKSLETSLRWWSVTMELDAQAQSRAKLITWSLVTSLRMEEKWPKVANSNKQLRKEQISLMSKASKSSCKNFSAIRTSVLARPCLKWMWRWPKSPTNPRLQNRLKRQRMICGQKNTSLTHSKT